jgi:hypothetical protein
MYAWESMKTYAGVSGRGVYVHDDGLAYLESATRWLDGRPLPVIWSAPWNPEGTESFDDRLAASGKTYSWGHSGYGAERLALSMITDFTGSVDLALLLSPFLVERMIVKLIPEYFLITAHRLLHELAFCELERSGVRLVEPLIEIPEVLLEPELPGDWESMFIVETDPPKDEG